MERATPDFLIGQMRLLTMRARTFFYVANQRTADDIAVALRYVTGRTAGLRGRQYG